MEGETQEEGWFEKRVSCKCGIILGFPPNSRFSLFPKDQSTSFSSQYIILSFSLFLRAFFLLTISTAWRRPSLSTFHPYLYSPSHFNLLQLFAYLIQTRSLHHHKTSIMTHLSSTFMSFFFTFKIDSMCYYAKYVLLWLWYIQLVLQFPLLHLSASLMQLWDATDISGDPHTGRMELNADCCLVIREVTWYLCSTSAQGESDCWWEWPNGSRWMLIVSTTPLLKYMQAETMFDKLTIWRCWMLQCLSLLRKINIFQDKERIS